MDGLLINTEDIITLSTNKLLAKYGRPGLTRSIRAQLMAVPESTNGEVFHNWAKLPISREQFAQESSEQMRLHFSHCQPLPGAEELVSNLSRAQSACSGERTELALASTTKSHTYELKVSGPETNRLLGFFRPERRILGDHPLLRKGRGKPAPDIYLLALQSLNSTVGPGEKPILPHECLAFEDSVVGVTAARRAGMRAVWVPHPDMAAEYQSRQKEVLLTGTGIMEVGDYWHPRLIDDGWTEPIPSLEHFDYKKYGIVVPS